MILGILRSLDSYLDTNRIFEPPYPVEPPGCSETLWYSSILTCAGQ